MSMDETYNGTTAGQANVETLLGRTEWLQSLARSLVRDAGIADDLVQDTCLALLGRPPGSPAPSLAWLRRVLRNLVYMRHREDANRRKRERAAARPEASASTPVQVLERAEIQMMLIELVLGLPEPYRSTVLLRFFEGRTPGQIAVAQQVPVTTVRSRLSRALTRLRMKLQRVHGAEGHTWVAAIAPLLVATEHATAAVVGSGAATRAKLAGASSSDLTSLAAGGAIMTTKAAIVLTAGTLVLVALGWGLGRVLPTADNSGVDLVALDKLEDLEGNYRQAVVRIEALEAAREERRQLDETLAAFTEELRGMGDAARDASVQAERNVRGREGPGLWSQLLDLGFDDYGLWNLLHSKGDLEALARLVEEVESWGADRPSRSELPEEERSRIESMLHRNRFCKGYIRFALGDLESAADAFREQIAAVDELEEVLVARDEKLEPVTAIFRGRSRHILDAMESVARKPAPADIQLGDAWATDRRASLSDLTGKAVALFFRRAGDTRSAGIMGRLSRYCASQPDMETMTLCYRRPGRMWKRSSRRVPLGPKAGASYCAIWPVKSWVLTPSPFCGRSQTWMKNAMFCPSPSECRSSPVLPSWCWWGQGAFWIHES